MAQEPGTTDKQELVIEGLGKGIMNYGMVLALHIDRTAKATTQAMGENHTALDTFFNSVRGLDSLLTPYKDPEYESEKKKIMRMHEPRDAITDIDEYYLWFGLLVSQIGKAGLLPAQTKGGDDSYAFNLE